MGSEWSKYQVCPPRGSLKAFLDGELSESESDFMAEHIDECDSCLDQLTELNRTSSGIEQHLKNFESQDQILLEPQLNALQTRVERIELPLDCAWTKASVDDSTKVIPQTVPARVRDYEILDRLGGGAMGDVYAARHVFLDKVVAIKFLADQHSRKSDRIERFQNEMKAIGSLSHPNVVAARDAGEFEGRYYLVMEYVDGHDASKLVEAHGYLRECDAAEIVRQAAEGLQYVHDSNRIHRDIKPSNLMVTNAGDVQILDLGLAKFSNPAEGKEALTETGYILGTLDYIAPEQADNSSRADIRSDIYSLGCCLYKLVTGSAPFESTDHDSTYAKIDAHRKQPPAPVQDVRPELSKDLDLILQRMLAKHPDVRFQSPVEIVDALKPLAEGNDLASVMQALPSAIVNSIDVRAATKPETRQAPERVAKRKSILSGIALVTVIFGVVVAALAWNAISGDGEKGNVPSPHAVQVEPIIWDEDSRSSEWSISEDSAIEVRADDVSLLGVGSTPDDVEFAVDIKQLPWSRQIGVFFGYDVIDGEGTYQALEIESVRDRKFQLVRYQRSFSTHMPLRQNTQFLSSVTIDDPNAVCELGFTIENGQLISVELDGKVLPELCRIEPNKVPSSAGRYGVFNNNSTGRFFNLRIDARRIELKQ